MQIKTAIIILSIFFLVISSVFGIFYLEKKNKVISEINNQEKVQDEEKVNVNSEQPILNRVKRLDELQSLRIEDEGKTKEQLDQEIKERIEKLEALQTTRVEDENKTQEQLEQDALERIKRLETLQGSR